MAMATTNHQLLRLVFAFQVFTFLALTMAQISLPPGVEIVSPKELGISDEEVDRLIGKMNLVNANGGGGGGKGPMTRIVNLGFDPKKMNLNNYQLMPARGLSPPDKTTAQGPAKQYGTKIKTNQIVRGNAAVPQHRPIAAKPLVKNNDGQNMLNDINQQLHRQIMETMQVHQKQLTEIANKQKEVPPTKKQPPTKAQPQPKPKGKDPRRPPPEAQGSTKVETKAISPSPAPVPITTSAATTPIPPVSTPGPFPAQIVVQVPQGQVPQQFVLSAPPQQQIILNQAQQQQILGDVQQQGPILFNNVQVEGANGSQPPVPRGQQQVQFVPGPIYIQPQQQQYQQQQLVYQNPQLGPNQSQQFVYTPQMHHQLQQQEFEAQQQHQFQQQQAFHAQQHQQLQQQQEFQAQQHLQLQQQQAFEAQQHHQLQQQQLFQAQQQQMEQEYQAQQQQQQQLQPQPQPQGPQPHQQLGFQAPFQQYERPQIQGIPPQPQQHPIEPQNFQPHPSPGLPPFQHFQLQQPQQFQQPQQVAYSQPPPPPTQQQNNDVVYGQPVNRPPYTTREVYSLPTQTFGSPGEGQVNPLGNAQIPGLGTVEVVHKSQTYDSQIPPGHLRAVKASINYNELLKPSHAPHSLNQLNGGQTSQSPLNFPEEPRLNPAQPAPSFFESEYFRLYQKEKEKQELFSYKSPLGQTEFNFYKPSSDRFRFPDTSPRSLFFGGSGTSGESGNPQQDVNPSVQMVRISSPENAMTRRPIPTALPDLRALFEQMRAESSGGLPTLAPAPIPTLGLKGTHYNKNLDPLFSKEYLQAVNNLLRNSPNFR